MDTENKEIVDIKRSGNVFYPTIEQIEVEEGFNIRFDYGDLESLAASIIANGVKVKLKGYRKKGEAKFILIDGHRRFEAIKLAHEKGHTDIKIPLEIDNAPSAEERVLSIFAYNDGKRLNMLEESNGFQRLVNYQWTTKEISSRIGKSEQWVKDCLLLQEAPKHLKNKIIEGLVSGNTVVEQLKKKKDINTVANDITEAIEKNNGNKVSAKNIDPKKPTRNEIISTVADVQNAEIKNALEAFQKFQNGEISKARFLVDIKETILA